MYIERQIETILTQKLESPKVTILLGARQVGKTTLIKHILSSKKTFFLNLDIDVDKNRFLSASALSPEQAMQTFGDPQYIVIDEAQRAIETGRIVKGWYDAGVKTKVILLGSSSLDLINQTAEALTGRNEKVFLTPLLFQEILAIQSWVSSTLKQDFLYEHFSPQIESLLFQSVVFGGYPERIYISNTEEFLLNLVSDYLLKDILQIGLVKTPDTVKRLLLLLAHQVGSEVSINELARNLAVSRLTIERYLELLEQTFVIFMLPAFSTNPRKEISKSKKIFFWDTGIRNALLKEFSLNPLRSDIGALWENWVIAELYKQNMLAGNRYNFYFWRSHTKSEVDLVIKNGDSMRAFEIKWKRTSIKSSVFTSYYNTPVELITSTMPLPHIC